ncbi:glucose-1-phosphate thymidylyltransferase [Candidatus Korarchaeum cryptofilum]|uniref:glucose-1-phosphate thymidylyltransferase n=1 Tax=Candidatus Korarchaeum cryptofilum TaxID=498846 RepID=UPI000AD29D17|nr:glucose-1-phosphate thymidylyltransferase [Candidatus Korarchaeum cryptofilum]
MKGLVLAGGEGSRLRPLSFSIPKHLIPLLGKAVIEYPIDHLLEAGIREIGVVIGYLGFMIQDYLSRSRPNASISYIKQEERLGIAHAIYRAIEEGFIDEEFAVYLGDNIIESGVGRHIKSFEESDFDSYVLLYRVRDPSRFGVAILRDGKVVKLVEKPKERISDLAVIGFYMFKDPELVARAFRTLKPSWRGEYEITELIQWFIDNGYRVGYDFVNGWWKDIGTPESLLDALYFLIDRIENSIKGEVRRDFSGRVFVEDGAIVEGSIYGPAYIGRNSYVAKEAVIEPFTSIEAHARVESGYHI